MSDEYCWRMCIWGRRLRKLAHPLQTKISLNPISHARRAPVRVLGDGAHQLPWTRAFGAVHSAP